MTLTNTNTGTASAVIWGQTIGTADPDHEQHDQEPEHRPATPPRRRSSASVSAAARIGTASLGTRNDNNRVQNNNITNLQFGIVSVGPAQAQPRTSAR